MTQAGFISYSILQVYFLFSCVCCRPYSCPCPGASCKWQGSLDQVMPHLMAQHKSITTLQGMSAPQPLLSVSYNIQTYYTQYLRSYIQLITTLTTSEPLLSDVNQTVGHYLKLGSKKKALGVKKPQYKH